MPPPAGAPVGFKRSRALWDNVNRPHETWVSYVTSYVCAILYEMQPVRLSSQFQLQQAQGWRPKWWCLQTWRFFRQAVLVHIPTAAKFSFKFLQSVAYRQWLWIGGAILYYFVVRWIHVQSEAGPVILITTALVMIFTVGLGDDEHHDGLSAYSVFNRGFQRLLGSVNEQDLLAQHVGGGFGAFPMGGVAGAGNDHDNDDDRGRRGGGDRPLQHQEPPFARRRPQAAAAADNVDNHNNNNDENDAGGEERQAQRRQQRPVARRTGKKARRRNLEQRQEMRRQREAAAAMGFAGDEADQAMALELLLEQQFREAEANQMQRIMDLHDDNNDDDDDSE